MVSILIDDELLLRSLEPSDAQELFIAVNESREHLSPWFPWVTMTTKPEHSLQFIQQSMTLLDNQEGIVLGIMHNRKLIGSMGMHNWNHDLKKAQLGYWISKDFENRGIIHVCLKSFIDFLFAKTGLNKIEIHFMVANERSAAVAKRLGFKIEGVIRQSYIIHGAYHDVVVTGLLKTEWPGLPKNQGKEFKAT